MNARQLIKLGVDEMCVKAAVEAIQLAARSGRLRSINVKQTIQDVVISPESWVGDPDFSVLANSVIEEREFVKPQPISYKAWGDDIDESTHAQMRQSCGLPMARVAAIMPDAHVGYGLPIGGVLALENAVVPYAVGVDIACLSGDTEIRLLDNCDYLIESLVGKGEFPVWSCKPDGKIVAAMATAIKTRKNVKVIRVHLDNGESVKCTPDHLFMMRDGSYKPASDLNPNDSLMPFYSKLDKDGYCRIQQNYSGSWLRAHWVIARSGLLGKIPKFLGQKTVIHHKNFIGFDNRPENLEFMGNIDHSSFHRGIVERNSHWQSEEFERKRKEALAKKASTKDGYQYFAERGRRNFKSYWLNDYERAKLNCAGNGQRGKKFLIARNQSESGKKLSKEIANRMWKCKVCEEEVRSHIGLYNHERSAHGMHPEHTTCKKTNHKVIRVESLDANEDVYCLNVPEYENFAISSGIFVHNCRMKISLLDLPADYLEDDTKISLFENAIEKGTKFGVGVNYARSGRQKHDVMDDERWDAIPLLRQLKDKAWTQLGTSGSGNHFVDVGLLTVPDFVPEHNIEPGTYIAILSHSGSRGAGASVCKQYSAIATKNIPKRYSEFSRLGWLDLDSADGQQYWTAMNLMGDYASANHAVIHDRITTILGAKAVATIENHHNFAWLEVHQGKTLVVHRKGATPAGKGVLGVIPGSMADPAFIVRGKGNPDSLNSASHGAGRRMSRTQAKNKYNFKAVSNDLAKKGIRIMSAGADEVPGVYKRIEEVMKAQEDLVETVARFDPKIVKMCGDGSKAED